MENLRHLHLPFFDVNECEEIISYIDEKQIILQKKYGEKYKHRFSIEKNSVYENLSTTLYQRYNFFKDNPKYISRLKKILEENFPDLNYPLFIQSWGNIYEKNQGIPWHTHSFINGTQTLGITSNIFIGGDENIGTTYAFPDGRIPKFNYMNVKNKIGYIQFVSNEIHHMVSPNKSDQKRYSIGITINEYDHRYSKVYVDSLAKEIVNLESGKHDKNGLLVIAKPDANKKSFIAYK